MTIIDKISILLNDTEQNWEPILNSIITEYNCTTGTLHFLEQKTNLLKVQAYVGIPDFLVPKLSVIPVGKGMAGIAAERREPVEMCNLQIDSSGVAKPAAKETKVEGAIAVPLLLNDTLYGVIGIGKQVPYDFTEIEIEKLLQIAEAICQVLKSQ